MLNDSLKKREKFLPKLKNLPSLPGVYLLKNENNDILYIGKAKSLRNRVRSYFQKSGSHNLRIKIMVSLVRDLSIILTDTEAEALILEEQLIKTHLPRYNVTLKDDKSYPYCKLTLNEKFPRLYLVREKHDPKTEYFGPFPSVKEARQVLKMVQRFFLLRSSKMKLDGKKTYRPCINFQLKRCLGPCRGTVPVNVYGEIVKQVRLFMKGRHDELLKDIVERMKISSNNLEFEKAALFRDQLKAVEKIFQKQTVVNEKGKNQDVYNLFRESNSAGIQVLFIRNGRLLGTDFFFYEDSESVSDENLLGLVLNRIYMNSKSVLPNEILLPLKYTDRETLQSALNEFSKTNVKVLIPKRGQKKELIEMAFSNAKMNLIERRATYLKDDETLNKVKKFLKLKNLPERIEAFDVSHLYGTLTVASMVSWKHNKPLREMYRKFRINNINVPDDYRSLKEVLIRRYKRSLTGEIPLPDLILIDGGKGQVNLAKKVLDEIGINEKKIDLLGIAKGRSLRKKNKFFKEDLDFEYLVKPNMKNEIRLNKNSIELHFFQRIRDESHRFAIEFQRQLKRKDNLHSVIEEIPGIGQERKKILLRHFGSLNKLKAAKKIEIEKVPNISLKLAEQIHAFFKS